MTSQFPCPYLKGVVDLTEEREQHITERHPDILPEYRARIAETLADPDHVRQSVRFGSAKLFSRWYTDLRHGKYIIVVIVSERDPHARHWIITAYIARTLAQGATIWERA